jgi:hypothetical protein
MADVLPNWFKADGYYLTPNGIVFTGPAPFDFDKVTDSADRFYNVPWLISHPAARKDCLYRVLAVESFALQWITQGQPIGLVVEEVPPA